MKRSKWYNFNKFIKFQQNQDFVTQKSDEKSGEGFDREWSQSTGFVELGARNSRKIFQGPHLDLEF